MASRLFSRICSRLRSEGAETIAETLVGILIASLSMALLASATAASTSIVQRTRTQARTYYEATSELAATPSGDNGSVSIKEHTIAGTSTTSLSVSDSSIDITWNEQVLCGNKTGISYSKDEG